MAHGAGDPVAHAMAEVAHHLPDQGPIGVFVHHNSLHALQHLPFHEAVVAGAALIGARPYLEADDFRAAWRAGRIEDADVDAVLPGSDRPVAFGLDERAARRAMLEADLDPSDADGVRFLLATGALAAGPGRELWNASVERLSGVPPRAAAPRPRRHRDVLVALGHADPDPPLHGELQRLSASFLDQGHALTPMPHRDGGFLAAVAGLYAAGASAPSFAPGVDADFRLIAGARTAPATVVREVVADLGVDADALVDFLEAELLAFPGWAGMFSRLERHPEERHGGPPTHLVDFVAVRLIYARRALVVACGDADLPLRWRELVAVPLPGRDRDPVLDAFRVHALAARAGATPARVRAAPDDEIRRARDVFDAWPDLARRRTLLEAYERRYRRQILDAIAENRRTRRPPPDGRPRAQFVFCIDEREESIRRALEEDGRDLQTFGVAGFFGVAIDYQGLDDPKPAAYCPVVVIPAHEVHEAPVYSDRGVRLLRERLRERWQAAQRSLVAGSRGLSWGAVQSVILGPLVGLATAVHVVAPRQFGRARHQIERAVFPMPTTRLRSSRDDDDARSTRGKYLGFTLDETVVRVRATLVNLGITASFAPIVVVLGHGSTSLNNPHESAHDCGACGGRRGGVNARLFAELANRPDVRAALAADGLVVPDDTWFVGALHDTADDSVRYYDLDRLPPASAAAFDDAVLALERARRANAKERARRFDDAPLAMSPDEALAHVEARAAHLAQPRPEYGHCTNAVCVVGRRALTRGLFLDRRAFLVSYDPDVDPTGAVLERILAAVGPVGAGINLEYYFSSVDNEVFGCGTKLPHNVTGLIGVMNGHQSDLRTGLPIQMVELHEAMRLLLIVEATPDALLAVAGRQPEVRELAVNGWVQLVSVDPETGAMNELRDGGFVPYEPGDTPLPRVARSADWYDRTRDHLPPAIVESARA